MARRRASRATLIAASCMLVAAVFIVGFTLITQARGLPVGGQHVKYAPTLPTETKPVAALKTSAVIAAQTAPGGPGSGALPTRTVAPVGANIDAYRGLGTWVDIYDAKAWRNPRAAVADMSHHGARTLYIETGNSSSPGTIFNPAAQRIFLTEAHKRGMRVVAWYLPELVNVNRDYGRIKAAIQFTAPGGQHFDSFALDIESPTVRPQSLRNSRLTTLSNKIRGLVGKNYPLGAIIPSPAGLQKPHSYWGSFPYSMCAHVYDVFVPMAYYTYHAHGGYAVGVDARNNITILRSKAGCAYKPIHMIGGISNSSSAAEVKSFVAVCRSLKVTGASMYGWVGTSASMWRELRLIALDRPWS